MYSSKWLGKARISAKNRAMIRSGFRYYLQILLIAALVLAGASPACKFISGKTNLIEICTAQGLKTVAAGDAQTPAPQKHNKTDQCAFCFAQAHAKSFGAVAPVVVAGTYFEPYFGFFDDAPLVRQTYSHFSARGPPQVS